MKLAKIFIIFTFLPAFALQVSAQENAVQNKAEIFQLFKKENLKELKFLVSTKEDVKALFGEKCESECDFGKNWWIRFTYVNKDWLGIRYYQKDQPRNKVWITKPKPEFVGKLLTIPTPKDI
jgi:hypothetical protein